MSKPKVLIFDIETAGVNARKADLGFVLMIGWKWLGHKTTHCTVIKKRDLKHFNDKPILTEFSKVYEQADLTVGHFSSVFDRRFVQGRMLIHGLPPLPFTKMRDTCMILRSAANYSSNSLNSAGYTLGLEQKKQAKGSGWPLWWFKAMQGDMKAVREMAEYCKQDVRSTEALYLRILPYDNAHPRIWWQAEHSCRKCGSKQVQKRGPAIKDGKRMQRAQCMSCASWNYFQLEKGREAV